MPTVSCADCSASVFVKHGRPERCQDCSREHRNKRRRQRRQGKSTRNPVDMRGACVRCGTEIVVGAANKRKYCEECVIARRRESDKARQSARRAANGHAEKYRDWTLLKRYGLTREAYGDLLVLQGDKCAICGCDSPGRKSWHVDHDHKSGKVRGLLCQRCNHMLGQARDNIGILLSAVDYLNSPSADRLTLGVTE